MSEPMEDLKEIAKLAAKAVASDDAGELPGYLLGEENYNRLIDLLVGLGALPVHYLEEKTRVVSRPKPKVTPDGTYTAQIRYK